MIIEVSTHGSGIHRRRERFLIKMPEQKDQEIPSEKVEAILVSANASITTQAMQLCVERQIQLVLTSYTGYPICRMWSSSFGRQTQIRRQQYLNENTVFAFNLIKKILLEKLSKQRRVLVTLRQNRTQEQLRADLSNSVSSITGIMNHVKKLPYEKNFAQRFLGFEGSCAVLYFQMISACLPKKWQFDKRTQNPGLDEFNTSLNYMYGLTYTNVEKIIIVCGLDPNAGFYHKDHYGKPTLSYDLIEPCRPIIDKALLYLFNKRIVHENWFADESGISVGIQLSKIGRSNLISCFKEECQNTIEKIVWQYCRELTHDLLKLDKDMP